MRKRIIGVTQETAIASEEWLDLGSLATVEVSSEADGNPIENALQSGDGAGWRAAQPGTQTIRLIFDEPQDLSRIYLEFVETEIARTQEFVLRWSGDSGKTFRDIVRQQWNFSRDSTREKEIHEVEIPAATILELTITPDISRGDARASVLALRASLRPDSRSRFPPTPEPNADSSAAENELSAAAIDKSGGGASATTPSIPRRAIACVLVV